MLKKIFFVITLLSYNFPIQCSSNIDATIIKRLNEFAQSAYSTLPTIYNSYQLSVECIANKIPGDFVECGF